MAADTLAFFRELPKNFKEIGSVIPSSRMLAASLARPIERAAGNKPLRILEVGPGTGPITRRILKLMTPSDTLVVCELNENFIKQLQIRLDKNKYFIRNRERVTFHHGPVQDFRGRGLERSFDAIVSSVPFSNMTAELVHDILSLYRELLTDEGSLTFVEYAGIRRIGSLLQNDAEKERIRQVDDVVKQWKENWAEHGSVERDFTFMNVPPAFTIEFNHRVPESSPTIRKRVGNW